MGDLLFFRAEIESTQQAFLAPLGADLLVLKPFWGEHDRVLRLALECPVYFCGLLVNPSTIRGVDAAERCPRSAVFLRKTVCSL